MTETEHGNKAAERNGPKRGGLVQANEPAALNGRVGQVLSVAQRRGLPPGVGQALILNIQHTAGNRAAQRLVGASPVTVQRKGPSVSGLKRSVGLGTKKPSAAAEAEQAGVRAKSAKPATVADLEKQITTLETATRKLVKAHQPGDTASHMAAFQVQGAAQRIVGNLPDQNSKASTLLGRTYPDQLRRLGRIVDETQLILDEVRVENTRRQAQDAYREAGRTDTLGQKGALTKLKVRNVFDRGGDQPAPNADVVAYLGKHGFTAYEQAFDAALAKKAAKPSSQDEADLNRLQPELFLYTEQSRSRAAARTMGLSAAELAAIQTYTAEDYSYINPATANAPAWLNVSHPDLADKADKTLEDWAKLQDELASSGQTLDQRMADRRRDLTALREEGGLHTGVAIQGLSRMPVWKGIAYRGQRMEAKRFYPEFVKKGDGFLPRKPTFTWKTVTSISKNKARGTYFSQIGRGSYRILFEFEVTNGRDIEGLSVNRTEREVALLPGAEFAYGPIEVDEAGSIERDRPWQLRIKATQIK